MIEHAAPCEVRAAGRTLTGPAMRYGDIAPGYRERFEPGAFESRSNPLTLNVQHDGTLKLASTDDVLDVADSARTLDVRAELPSGSAALTLVRSGRLTGLSVGFHSLREHRDEHGVRVIERAHLDHIALVDRPAYPSATVEVRRTNAYERYARLTGEIPVGRPLQCECSGPDCGFASFEQRAIDDIVAKINGAKGALDDVDTVLAAWKDYGSPLTSNVKGGLRARAIPHGVAIDVDLPDIPATRSLLDAARTTGIVLRPFLKPLAVAGARALAEHSRIETVELPDDLGRLSGLTVEAGKRSASVRVWTRGTSLRAVLISATDARGGWPEPRIVEAPDAIDADALDIVDPDAILPAGAFETPELPALPPGNRAALRQAMAWL